MKRRKKTTKRFESTELKRNRSINDDTKKIFYFFGFLILVVGCLVGLYFLNGNLVTKDLKKEDTTTTEEINIDQSVIMMNDIFDQGKEYLVMMYDSTNKTNGFLYDSLVSSYKGELELYSVDMSLKMNSKYYNEEGKENKEPENVEDFVITKPTLVRIKKGTVREYITDSNEINERLTAK